LRGAPGSGLRPIARRWWLACALAPARFADGSGGPLLELRIVGPALARPGPVPEAPDEPGALHLDVPPLAERRDEIPGLVRCLLRERGAGAVPTLEDGALALLWRQPWPGQLAELSAVVRELAGALRAPARATSGGAGVLDASAVRAHHRRRRLRLRERIDPRRARPLDLELALESTRHRNGAANPARAARYLGWDPDTLRRRLALEPACRLARLEPGPAGEPLGR